MALVLSGSLVISGSGTQQPQVDTFGNLKACVARSLNGENQPKILELAGEGIKRAIVWVNLHNRFRFGSKQASDTALVAGTGSYSLPADFFAVQDVQLIDSDSKVVAQLEYLDWGQFNRLEPKQTATGQPVYWTSRNAFDDNAIQLYPVPDSADHSLRVTYYERIQRPSVDSDIIDAPQELGIVLCTYAESYVVWSRDSANVAKWGSAKREAQALLKQFVHSTEEEPSTNMQWRMGWDNGARPTEFDPLG